MSAAPNSRAGGRAEEPAAISIGAVLEQLLPDFPDISISKIRYLEDQRLVEPQRTASGYRKFGPADVDRLRYVLGMQREHYMPLRVIRDHLQAVERGLEAPVGPFGAAFARRFLRDGPHLEAVPEPVPAAPQFQRTPEPQRRFTRGQVLAAAGIEDGVLAALESHGLLAARPAGHFDADAVAIARAAGELAAFGIEPRHLRAFRTAADREAGLIEQVTTSIRHRGEGSDGHVDDVTQELSGLCLRLHAALVKAALERGQS